MQKNNLSKRVIINIVIMVSLALIGFGLSFLAAPHDYASTIKVIGALWFAYLLFYQIVLKEESHRAIIREATEQIRAAEENYRKHPEKPQAAWHLAQTKLEAYLNRNLEHIQRIFQLIVLVIVGGWILIAVGIILLYADITNVSSSILAAASGAISQFIGVTLLLIYRTTIKQANNYVSILEKINVIGMSLQIIDSSNLPNEESQANARIELSQKILSMYMPDKNI